MKVISEKLKVKNQDAYDKNSNIMSEYKKCHWGVSLRVGLSAASPRCGRASLAVGFPLLSLTQKTQVL